MKIYVNDIPVSIKDKKKLKNHKPYDLKIDDDGAIIPLAKLKGRVLIENKSFLAIDKLLKIMTNKKHNKLKCVDIVVKNKLKAKEYFISHFNLVEAAGGLVEKQNEVLMILRNGLWDIPKGKLDKGEKRRDCAVREIEEETGVKAEIIEKIGTTWHTYLMNQKYVIKKTHWYRLKCLNESKIKPQKSEGIEKVIWMTQDQIDIAMQHSFKTIKQVIKKHRLVAAQAIEERS